jgi:FRG domain
MQEIRVRSWNELNESLYEGSWQENLQRFRSSHAFRGAPDTSLVLSTSLVLLGGVPEEQERHLLRNFRKFARLENVLGDSVWNWLALGQHHGLPTRLLDWTFSPYVALHFATADPATFRGDSVIWCVDYVGAHELVPESLRRVLDNEGANVFTTEMLEGAARSLDEFDGLSDQPFVIFMDPPSLDSRIVNRFALFSVMSSASGSLDDWMQNHQELARRIVLPASLKWEVRDKLDQANITERVLFPGLDGLSRWLKRYYTPRRPKV